MPQQLDIQYYDSLALSDLPLLDKTYLRKPLQFATAFGIITNLVVEGIQKAEIQKIKTQLFNFEHSVHSLCLERHC